MTTPVPQDELTSTVCGAVATANAAQEGKFSLGHRARVNRRWTVSIA